MFIIESLNQPPPHQHADTHVPYSSVTRFARTGPCCARGRMRNRARQHVFVPLPRGKQPNQKNKKQKERKKERRRLTVKQPQQAASASNTPARFHSVVIHIFKSVFMCTKARGPRWSVFVLVQQQQQQPTDEPSPRRRRSCTIFGVT